MIRQNEIWILAERDDKLREMDSDYLLAYINQHTIRATYDTREDAEEARMRGDAYDDPRKTKVVGFRIERIKQKEERA